MAEEGVVEKGLPLLELAEGVFLLGLQGGVQDEGKKEWLKKKIAEEQMSPYYEHVCQVLHWGMDTGLLDSMKKANEEQIQKLDAAIKDATENLGESEVREAHLAKANYYAKIGDKNNAVNQYRLTMEKTVGSGQKLDILFTLIRIGLFWMDHDLITRNIEKARVMVDQGSDWDRRNRLKVYEGLYLLSVRKFNASASLLLETVATFSAVELLDYQSYVYYTVLMAVVSLNRVALKQKVIDSPEILAVIDNIPHLGTLMNSLYQCNYASYFTALAGISESMKVNRYLAPHTGFFCKEMKIKGYNQILESYKTVQLETMASAFGVSAEFIDRDLSRFIASGRIHCKIDKVGGIVETSRTDNKNEQYHHVIKNGDALLNKLQRLSRVINL